jgi:short-subunit dehydrogenase
MMELTGTTALLTGASRGIGPHIARALAAAGVRTMGLVARDAAALERVAADLAGRGVRAVPLPSDLTVAAARADLAARAIAALGPVDVLVNNAGVENEGPFLRLDAATIDETIAVNLAAPMHLTRLLLPKMLERRRGFVVNVASLAGKKTPPFDALYGGTKAGLIEWTLGLRNELRGTGVSLGVVCPGYVTGEGMFAKFGMAPPVLVGSCTPAQVAHAVVRCVRRNDPEVFVNSRPVRPLLALAALSPRLTERLVGALGITAFQRRKVGA